MKYKEVKKKDKRKMQTILKLIGRTGIGRFGTAGIIGIAGTEPTGTNRSKLIGTQPPGKSPLL